MHQRQKCEFYDLLGNAFEWGHDGLSDWTTLPTDEAIDPVGSLLLRDEAIRIVRGGNIIVWSSALRAASRSYLDAPARRPGIGFRLVRTLP